MIDRALDEIADALNPEAARRLVDLRADKKLVARVAYLASRANEGELTEDERSEYLGYITVSEILALLQARARQLIARSTAA